MKQPIYLVPFDFSKIAENAMRIAINLAKRNDGTAYLLNIVKRSNQKASARNQFTLLTEQLSEEDKERVTTKVIEGELYRDVGKAGDILKSALVVMGTRGAVGMQKVFGSHSVRILEHSASPFLITHESTRLKQVKNIAMPFSFDKETVQISQFAGNIAKQFDAKIHLIGYYDDDKWLKKKLMLNQRVVNDFFEKNGIETEVVNISSNKNFEKELLDYAHQNNVDMLAAAYFKNGIFRPSAFIQSMIENKHEIPLLTVNADELFVVNSTLTFMTM